MTKSKELIKVDEATLLPTTEAFKELQVNLEGVDPVFPRINILHRADLFEMPDESKGESFQGIILDTNVANAFWSTSYDDSGGGDPPDCFSPDAIAPDLNIVQAPEAEYCKPCPKNQFGSADDKEDDRKKACKNMRRVHIMLPGTFLPYRLALSPANLKPMNLYLTVLTSQGLSYQHVLTTFSLKPAKNKKGVEYSEIVLKKAQVIKSPDIRKQLKDMKAELKGAMRGQIILPDEYEEKPAPPSAAEETEESEREDK